MAILLGKDCYLYRNTGSFGSPTWDLIDVVGDVEVGYSMNESDVSHRGAGGQQQMEPTLQVNELTFTVPRDPSNADQTALITAFFARTLIEFAIANGPIATNGTKYWRQEMKIFAMPNSEPINGHSTIAFTVKPCFSTNAASLVTVSA